MEVLAFELIRSMVSAFFSVLFKTIIEKLLERIKKPEAPKGKHWNRKA